MLLPIFIKHERVLKRIDPLEITCMVSRQNYTDFKLVNGKKYIVRTSITALVEILPELVFIKISPKTIVSVFHIDVIEKDHLCIGTESFKIGKSYYNSILSKLISVGVS